MTVMTVASERLTVKRNSFRGQRGWHQHVADLRKVAKDCFVMWRKCGKPRQGCGFLLMQQSRAQFKYAVRFVKRNENAFRGESLVRKLTLGQSGDFWKEIRTTTPNQSSSSSCVEGVSGK